MYLLTEISSLTAVKALLVGIPESIELFVFGVGLIGSVVLLRWFLDRGKIAETDEELAKRN
jgi:hypothetical protein